MTTATPEPFLNLAATLRYAAGTDIGRRREENQDSFGVIDNPNFRIFLVADGMGGVKGGAIASNLALETLRSCLESRSELLPHSITSAVQQANSQVFERGGNDPALSGMGTTLVGVAFSGERMFMINVGDSRLYRIRDRKIKQLTEDHTLVGELLRSGAITREQAANHPVSHMLTRSLGPTPAVDIDCEVCTDGPARGDSYVLCSDGLYNLVSQEEIGKIVYDNSLDEAVQILIGLANQRGGTDNITVIILRVGEDFPVTADKFPDDSDSTPFGDDTLELNLAGAGFNEMNGSSVNGHAKESSAEPESSAAGNGSDGGHAPDAASSNEAQDEWASGAAERMTDETAQAKSNATKEQGSEFLGGGHRAARAARDDAETTQAQPVKSQRMPPLVAGLVLGALGTVAAGVFGAKIWGGAFTPAPQSIPSSSAAQYAAVIEKLSNEPPPPPPPPPVHIEVNAAKSNAAASLSEAAPVSSNKEDSAGEVNVMPPAASGEIIAAPEKAAEVISPPQAFVQDAGLSDGQISKVKVRRDKLQALADELNGKLENFDRPLSGETGALLQSASRALEDKKREIDEVRATIGNENRKLSDLYSRRKRIETTDAINLAAEVAVFSGDVAQKKDEFEKTTWVYLREAEVLRYNPSDTVQQEKVRKLSGERREKMTALSDAIKHAVTGQIAESDKRVAELTVSESALNEDVKKLSGDVEYAKLIMSDDPDARERMKKDLMRQRKIVLAELEELSKMLLSDLDELPAVETNKL